VTGSEIDAVAPLASCTVALKVVAPFGVAAVFQGSVTCTPGSFALPTVAPPALSVKTFAPAAARSTQILTHTVPLTVTPLDGLVMTTLGAPAPGDGAAAAF